MKALSQCSGGDRPSRAHAHNDEDSCSGLSLASLGPAPVPPSSSAAPPPAALPLLLLRVLLPGAGLDTEAATCRGSRKLAAREASRMLPSWGPGGRRQEARACSTWEVTVAGSVGVLGVAAAGAASAPPCS